MSRERRPKPGLKSRSGVTDLLGKCTARIDVPCSEQMREDFRAYAHIHGIPPAEPGRQILEDFLYGRIGRIRRLASRVEAGDGRNEG